MHAATAANEASGLPFEEADDMIKDIKDELVSREALTADHEEIERLIADKTTALARALMMQAHLDLRAAKERAVKVAGADGIARAQARESMRTLETIFGEVMVTRRLYQAPGAEGLAPMDAALNLPAEHSSHGVRRFVAEECARASFDGVVEALERRTGAHVPKRQVEELSVRAAQNFDAFYAERARAAEDTSDLLILSFAARASRCGTRTCAPERARPPRPPRGGYTRVSRPGKKPTASAWPWWRRSIRWRHGRARPPMCCTPCVRPRSKTSARSQWTSVSGRVSRIPRSA